MNLKRTAGALVALAFVATACGGASGGNPGEVASADASPAESSAPTSEPAEEQAEAAEPSTAESQPGEEPAAAADLGENQLPEVDVIDLVSGETVNLASFAPADRPIVLWFWAPFWSLCRVEAPDVEQFAQQHGDEVLVIGVGAQNSLEQAIEFAQSTGTESFPMVWDPSFQSWQELQVAGQPQGRLLTAGGEVLAAWAGRLPEDEILAAIAEL